MAERLELMARDTTSPLPVAGNMAIAAGLGGAAVLQYVVLPVWLLPTSAHWGWLMLPLVLLTTPWWSLLHEGFHGLLHPDRRVNDGVGRALAIGFATPFRVVRFGHLMHHRFNRTALDRAEVTPARRPGIAERAIFYLRLVVGLYLAEVASAVLALAPRPIYDRAADAAFGQAEGGLSMADAAERHLKSPAARRELRLDGALVLLLLGGSFWLYGEAWWLLALGIAGRGVLQSVADNAYHYATPLDDRLYAMNLRLPRALERFCLNFTLHRVHHRRPGLPWTALPAAFVQAEEHYDRGFATAVLAQFRGPLPADSLVADDEDDRAGRRRGETPAAA